MSWHTRTVKLRGYTSKAGYARVEDVLGLLRDLWNGGLEERKRDYLSKCVPTWVADKDGDGGDWHMRLPEKTEGEKRSYVGLADQNLQLKFVRADNAEYEAIDRFLTNGVLERLDNAYSAAIGRKTKGEKTKGEKAKGRKAKGRKAGFPRFKSAGQFRSITARTVKASWLKWQDEKTAFIEIKGLPRIELKHKGRLPEPVRGADGLTAARKNKKTGEMVGGGKKKRTWEQGTWPRSIGIKLKGRRLWVTLVYDVCFDPLPATGRDVGIDRGVTRRCAFSAEGYEGWDGSAVEERAARKRARDDVRVKQINRKQARLRRAALKDGRAHWEVVGKGRVRLKWHGKPSGEYRKAGAVRRNILERRRIAESQATHRLTTDIVRQFDRVVMEDLSIRDMTRSAAGTLESPGRNVKAKRGLNREILAKQWGELSGQIAYKAESAGRVYAEVNPRFTSQVCHRCGAKGERKGARFRCVSETCGWQGDADDNGAINILARNLAEVAGLAWPCSAEEAGFRGEPWVRLAVPSPVRPRIVARSDSAVSTEGSGHRTESFRAWQPPLF